MSSLMHHKSVRLAKPTRGHQPGAEGVVRTDHELVDRLQQWKHITKSLLYYHKGLADIEHAAAKSTLALTETIQVPFHEGHVFSPDGWQQTFYDVRDDTKLLAERHSAFAQTIESTVVRQLESIRSDIKSQITAVEKEATAVADEVEKEREASKHALLELQSGIDTFENSTTQMLPQKDPYLSHHIVHNQLKKQVHKENDLQTALIRFQQQQPAFEEGVSRRLQSSIKLYEDARLSQLEEVEALHKRIAAALQRVEPTAEWEYFSNRTDNSLVDPNTPLRSLDAIHFPGLDHASTKPIKEGYLERKKRFGRSYKESYYVLTPSGYLHERKSSNAADTTAPGFSLFLPECSLSAPAKDGSKSHKFHIEGNKAVKSSFESKMKNSLRFGGKEIAYTFRARTRAEMLGWWETLDQLSRDTKTEVNPRSTVSRDPVGLAVANIGYAKPNSTTHSTAESVASVPGTQILTEDEAAERDEHQEVPSVITGQSSAASIRSSVTQPSATAPTGADASSRSVKSVSVAPPTDGAVDGLHSHDHHQEVLADDDDSEEGGGSSEEEYDSGDELAVARTAPSTPATGLGHSNPLDSQTINNTDTSSSSAAHLRAETLPAYVGSGTSQPEKAAFLTESKGAPILGNVVGSSSAKDNHVQVLETEGAPATHAATTSAS
ncbi:hypothetical protein JCM8097_003118 [Rhodosporidiobolus ruineniae]